jgi:hypothetical protein
LEKLLSNHGAQFISWRICATRGKAVLNIYKIGHQKTLKMSRLRVLYPPRLAPYRDIYGDHTFCCNRGSKKRAHNIIAIDFARASLSPFLAHTGYFFPNTPMAVKQLFHFRSDSTARPFDISFSPDPTACHYCPYTTIGADINITGPPPTTKT